MSKIVKVVSYPILKFCELLCKISPELLTKIRYFFRFKKFLNLDNPKNLNEKIQWLKLRSDISEWSRLSDKYAVREYVKECGCEDNLVELLGRWDRVEDIDFDTLPKSFVLKANNGCGSIIIVENKYELDITTITNDLNRWITTPYALYAAEIHYKSIKPCIIAEELLYNDDAQNEFSVSLIDYKVWCFNGKPHYILTCTNRDAEGVDLLIYDLDWKSHENDIKHNSHYRLGKSIPRPECLSELLNVAEKLSTAFPCVRVDLYVVNNKVYFGEMTFTSLGGLMNYFTNDFLLKTGSLIDLNYKSQ